MDASVNWVGHSPHPALRGHIRRITGFRERTAGLVYRREVPTDTITLILSLGDPIRISSDTGAGTFTAFLAGLHEIPVHTEHDGTLRCMQIDLSPLGAYRLLGLPMTELTDVVVGPGQLTLPGWPDLGERLAAQPDWPARFELAERTLFGWAERGRAADPEVRWAWGQLARSHGAAPVGALASEVGWSRRHFTDRFRRQVGLPPKPAAQVLRFRHALHLLGSPGAGSIADVAARAGYADHSHLAREVRRLTGLTPSELLAEQAPEGAYPPD
ncbi:helix-turn-helix domain-containing protein [Pseudonocardia eucalypti]|uniref:Helix-turn-helix domain-containing protein n=1 Tax=Pseudonocardia eucalypti TaxID=648755 RepID=A0ABP9PJD6_9PSEU|nr:AraC-like DNA-binding protein [Pseudonocardia eucalypti]